MHRVGSSTVLAAAAVLTLAADAAAAGPTTHNDYAKGQVTGQVDTPAQGTLPAEIGFNAVSGFSGYNPRGTARFTLNGGTVDGAVTCLYVAGNVAEVEGWVTRVTGEPVMTVNELRSFHITAVDSDDNGPDVVGAALSEVAPMGSVSDLCRPQSTLAPVQRGQIVVEDG